jgi:carboxyl-terminal processing protease
MMGVVIAHTSFTDISSELEVIMAGVKCDKLCSYDFHRIHEIFIKLMTLKRAFYSSALLVVFTSLGFGIGYLVHAYWGTSFDSFPILVQAYDILKNHGIKDLPSSSSMEYGMIHGMVEVYDDPYTMFVEPVQHELESNTLQGSFGGIGVRISRDEENYIVLYPIQESPAEEVGIQDGDRLLVVGSLSLSPEISMETAQAELRGPVGESVTVTIGRKPDYFPIEYKMRRTEFPLPSVTWHLDVDEPRLGVIEVNVFAASTPEEIQKAVDDLGSRGASAYVLDLRDNFGGLLTAGVDVARLFLEDGVVIEQQFRGQNSETFRIMRPGPLAEVPLVLIINQHTASAAEIVAGSLKSHSRAILIGVPTLGKDTIQLVFDLMDESSMHVTAARWWVPGLYPPVGKNGVQPDIVVDSNPEEVGPDLAIQSAKKFLFNEKNP